MNSDESNFLINSEDGVFFNPVKHNKPVLIKVMLFHTLKYSFFLFYQQISN